MTARLKHILIKIVGWAFILLGLAGLFLPILQGILFLLIGLSILSAEYIWARRLMAYLRKRFPHLNEQFKKASAWAARWRHANGAEPAEHVRDRKSGERAGKIAPAQESHQ